MCLYIIMSYQDWTEVKIGGGKIYNDPNNKNKIYNPINTQNQPGNKLFKKLDSDEIFVPEKVEKKISQTIQVKRNLCKLTQKNLANLLNLNVSIINDIESGKLTLNKSLITRINNYLDNTIKKNNMC